MKTVIKDISIEAGTTYRRRVRFFTDAARTIPLDLTGYVLAMWIWRGSDKIEFAIEVPEPEEGYADIVLEPEQTVDVLPGDYKHDFLLRDAGGDVVKTMKGKVTIFETGTKLPND